MEKNIEAEIYQGYYLAATLKQRNGRFLDTYTISSHRPQTHEQTLISLHSRSENDAKDFATKDEAKQNALVLAKSWVNENC